MAARTPDPSSAPAGTRSRAAGGTPARPTRPRPENRCVPGSRSRRPARFHRLDRHPGRRRRRAQPRPVPGGRRWPPAAADREPLAAQAARLGRRRWSPCAPSRTPRTRSVPRRSAAAGRRRRPGRWPARTRRPRWPARRATSCSTASPASIGPGADPRRAGRRQHARAGQQGVADRRRPARHAAAAQPGQIVPVDSEHSALAQCLRGGRPGEVDRLVLTASGGPFRGRPRADAAPTSRPSRRWPTRPGPWARWSRSTPPPWSTRGSR